LNFSIRFIPIIFVLMFIACSSSNQSQSPKYISCGGTISPPMPPGRVLIDSTLKNISYYEPDKEIQLASDYLKGKNKTLPSVDYVVIPLYPELARRAGLDGHVIVKVLVSSKGKVLDATIYRSDAPIFEKSVLEAIAQWTFKPLITHGKSQQFVALVPFYFRIK
jgi:TonB family protein